MRPFTAPICGSGLLEVEMNGQHTTYCDVTLIETATIGIGNSLIVTLTITEPDLSFSGFLVALSDGKSK